MRELHDGRDDGLEPLEPLDVRGAAGFADLLRRMARTAFGGRELGEAFEVLSAMAADPDCTIVVTVSGAMTVAQMGLVLCEMIEQGLAHLVVSTGAIMAHGLSAATGGVHYKHDPSIPDPRLYQWGYNRVYDTVEMEANLLRGQDLIAGVIADWDPARPMCSWELNREIGRRLCEHGQMPSVLGCAYRRGAPVYVPAFTDSDMGLSVSKAVLGRENPPGREKDLAAFFAPSRPTIRSSICTTTPGGSFRPSGWASSPWAGACRGTGPNRSGPWPTSSTCGRAWNSRRRGSNTRSASAPSPSIGAD